MNEPRKSSGNQPEKPQRLRFQKYMIRPTVYKAFSRFILALTASLLWDRFINMGLKNMRMWAFLFFGLLFIISAWMCYLRLDGMKMPRIKKPEIKKKPIRTYGDLPDHIDEEIISFDELEENERDLCCLIANLVLGVAFMALSLI